MCAEKYAFLLIVVYFRLRPFIHPFEARYDVKHSKISPSPHVSQPLALSHCSLSLPSMKF